MGEPYYAPKEEPLYAKDSAQLRKIEERDKQTKYAKKLGESKRYYYVLPCIAIESEFIMSQRSSRLKLGRESRKRELK